MAKGGAKHCFTCSKKNIIKRCKLNLAAHQLGFEWKLVFQEGLLLLRGESFCFLGPTAYLQRRRAVMGWRFDLSHLHSCATMSDTVLRFKWRGGPQVSMVTPATTDDRTQMSTGLRWTAHLVVIKPQHSQRGEDPILVPFADHAGLDGHQPGPEAVRCRFAWFQRRDEVCEL